MDDLTDFDVTMALQSPAKDRRAFEYMLHNIEDWDFDDASDSRGLEGTLSLPAGAAFGGRDDVMQDIGATGASGLDEQGDVMDLQHQGVESPRSINVLAEHHALNPANSQSNVLSFEQLADVASPRRPANEQSHDISTIGGQYNNIELPDVQHNEPVATGDTFSIAGGAFPSMPWSGQRFQEQDEFADLLSDVELLASEGLFSGGNLKDNAIQPAADQNFQASPHTTLAEAPIELSDASQLFGLAHPSISKITGVGEQTVPELLPNQEVLAALDQQLIAPSAEDSIPSAQVESVALVGEPTSITFQTAPFAPPPKTHQDMASRPPRTPGSLAEAVARYERGHHTNSAPGATSLRKAMNWEQNVNSPPEPSPVHFRLSKTSHDVLMRGDDLFSEREPEIPDSRNVSSAHSPPPTKKRRIMAARKPRIVQPSGQDQNSPSIEDVQTEESSSPLGELLDKKALIAPDASIDVKGIAEDTMNINSINVEDGVVSAKLGNEGEQSITGHGVRLLQQRPRRKSDRLSGPVTQSVVDKECEQLSTEVTLDIGSGVAEATDYGSASSNLSSADEGIIAESSMLDADTANSKKVEPDAKKERKRPKLKQEKQVQRKSTRAQKPGVIQRTAAAPAATEKTSSPAQPAKANRRSTLNLELMALGGTAPDVQKKKRIRDPLKKNELMELGAVEKTNGVSKRKTRGQEAEEAKAQPNAAMAAKKRSQQRRP